MMLPTLYKRSNTGAVLVWYIEVQDNKHRTHSGQQGGVITITEWTSCKAKNIGKANATTDTEQALKDAQSKWKKKIDREQFVEDISQIDTHKYIQPMLAQPFEERVEELNFKEKVWVQCKLNGARCIATKDGLFSRKGSVWQSVPHINNALKDFFNKYPDVVFDGELFNESLRQDLGSIISLISKKKITSEIIEKSKQLVQYYIYDIVDTSKKYEDRLQAIKNHLNEINSPYINGVDSWIVTSVEDINTLLFDYEEQGHEGAIVRTNGVYEHKRSKNLLKYKTFIDDEFEIVDVLEGEGNLTGMVGKFELKNTKGVTFRSSPTGSHDYWKQLWSEKDSLIGKMATVKFKELTPEKNGQGGVPSFGKVVAIRNYE
jgi:DNA ligase-1